MDSEKRILRPFITPAAALGLSIGTSVGWGSFVVTTNLYLLQAGPLGSAIGMAVGALIMLIVSWNYHYMMNLYPDSGGVYTYTKRTFGHDYGFLTAWFLGITYAAILWANATSLPIFSKYFLGEMFRFGKLYTLFGYDVYLGEMMLTVGALLVTGFLLIKTRNIIKTIAALLGGIFTLGIVVCFVGAMIKHEPAFSFDPAFIPDKGALEQILRVASVSSWAFVGFECISHASEEFTFHKKHAFSILSLSVVITTLLYVFVMVLSVTCYPDQFSSWTEYLTHLDELEGIEALPAFHAARYYMGNTGLTILIAALLAIILSSLVGNMFALSRLVYKLSSDGVLPAKLSYINKLHNPSNAIMAIVLVSCLIPLLGRTTIGWIVDVNTIGATIAYGFISAAVLRKARETGALREKLTGAAGLIIMIMFGIYLLLPSVFGGSSMAKESYFLFTVWSVLGIIFFRSLLIKDREEKYGKSVIVWIFLILLVLFASLDWMLQQVTTTSQEATRLITEYYSNSIASDAARSAAEDFVAKELADVRNTNMTATLVVVMFFSLSMGVMLNNFILMRKREKEKDMELGAAKAMATTDALTGVKNKHAYSDYEQMLNDKILSGKPESFAIAICDVNGLKQVNDTLGHKAGDRYIQQASKIICSSFDHSPVFRIGGDEFLAILTGVDYENRADIMHDFNALMEDNRGKGEIVVAAGISDFDAEFDSAVQNVFQRADKLMYERKKELKNGAEVR